MEGKQAMLFSIHNRPSNIFSLTVMLHVLLGDEQQDTMRNGATRLELVAKELLLQFGWRSTYIIS
uniref:Uncharacterized protein n=1 Tax=Oryza glumipatula TaxID=40148 RepID=A0A0E0BCI7_9ORYZ